MRRPSNRPPRNSFHFAKSYPQGHTDTNLLFVLLVSCWAAHRASRSPPRTGHAPRACGCGASRWHVPQRMGARTTWYC